MAFRMSNVQVNGLYPARCSRFISSLEPKFTVVSLDRNLELALFVLSLLHEALVKIEVEDARVVTFAVFLLEVLQNAILELNMTALPSFKDGRTKFFECSVARGWLCCISSAASLNALHRCDTTFTSCRTQIGGDLRD